MATMKYPNISGGNNTMAVSGNGSHIEEVDPVFTTHCWQHSGANLQSDYIDSHKLILDGSMSNLGSDKLLLGSPIGDSDGEIATKATMDALDNLLLSSQPMNNANNLAELKPLPPFTNYTANLSINGIQGHHYHAIAQRIPEENNNSYNSYNEQNIVSSSTCNVSADSAGDNNVSKGLYNVDDFTVLKLNYDVNADSVGAKAYEDCGHPSADSVTRIKTEITEYDISSIEDIAAIIGSAIADTTVHHANPENDPDQAGSRDSWMDLDAWIDDQQKNLIISQDNISEFVIPNTSGEFGKAHTNQMEFSAKIQPPQGTSTLQSLLTHGFVPLMQGRSQNGPQIKQEVPSSTNYSAELITTSSPPANVVSTTENLMVTVNGRFLPQYNLHGIGTAEDRIRSPDILGQNYPHTTTTSTPNAPKKSRSRSQKKQQQQQQQAASSTVFQTEQNLGLLGKEKPVHRCSICNRGFLNKSNIKVHLRTHTGEKPFRCETCAKAFRQKAHLLKHQQIHKRIGRD